MWPSCVLGGGAPALFQRARGWRGYTAARWIISGPALIEARRPGIDLEVDGGIEPHTAPLEVQAGARVLVAGWALFGPGEGVAAAMQRMLRAVLSAD